MKETYICDTAQAKPKISIIIPVYNAGQYIRKNIESVLNQTYTDFEVIYICDGCADNSYEILCQYTDKRIKVINYTKNRGTAVVRNEGLETSSGEWIIFWDADDTMDEDMLGILYENAIKYDADIAICGYDTVDGSIEAEQMFYFELAKKKLPSYPLYEKVDGFIDVSLFAFANAPYNKLINKKLLLNEEIKFQNLPNCNDVFFSISVIISSDRIVYVDKCLYCYRNIVPNNISSNRNNKKTYILEALDKIWEFAKERNYPKELLCDYVYKEILCYRGKKVFDELMQCYEMMYKEKWGINFSDNILYYFSEPGLIYGKKVILYGTGHVGKDYYHTIRNFSTVVLWTDSNSILDGVNRIENIGLLEFDYVLVAVKSGTAAKEIKKSLIDRGIPRNKILWHIPVTKKLIEER